MKQTIFTSIIQTISILIIIFFMFLVIGFIGTEINTLPYHIFIWIAIFVVLFSRTLYIDKYRYKKSDNIFKYIMAEFLSIW